MLLRSSYTPILKYSWLPHSKDSSPESESLVHLPRTRSVSITCSFHSPYSPLFDPAKEAEFLALSEPDLKIPPLIKTKQNKPTKASHRCDEGEHENLKTISRSPPDRLQNRRRALVWERNAVLWRRKIGTVVVGGGLGNGIGGGSMGRDGGSVEAH